MHKDCENRSQRDVFSKLFMTLFFFVIGRKRVFSGLRHNLVSEQTISKLR